MNRRHFLRSLLAAAAAAAAPTYFLPPIGGWKSDVIANPMAEIERELGYRAAMTTTYLYGAEAILTENFLETELRKLKKKHPGEDWIAMRNHPSLSDPARLIDYSISFRAPVNDRQNQNL